MERYTEEISPPKHSSNGKYFFLRKNCRIVHDDIRKPFIIFSFELVYACGILIQKKAGLLFDRTPVKYGVVMREEGAVICNALLGRR